MAEMKYDLTIAHRVCPVLASVAVGFSDKFEMVRETTDSLAAALKGIRTRLVVILDGCDERYEKLFRSLKLDGVVEVIRTDAIGNAATFSMQVQILGDVHDSEFVYFSEDDYLYAPRAFEKMLDFMAFENVDFVTPLDHPDRYNHMLECPGRVAIRVSQYCHWRECYSSCLTFMTRAENVRLTRKIMMAYSGGAADGLMWTGLTKYGLFDAITPVRALLRWAFGGRKPRYGEAMPMLTWCRYGLRLAFSRRYRLWSPLPTLAVHLARLSLPLGSDRFVNGVRQTMLEYLNVCNGWKIR